MGLIRRHVLSRASCCVHRVLQHQLLHTGRSPLSITRKLTTQKDNFTELPSGIIGPEAREPQLVIQTVP